MQMVSKMWNMVIDGLLPVVKSVSMTSKKKGSMFECEFTLYSGYNGSLVYISNSPLYWGNRNPGGNWLYLFKMEKVWYERCEQRLVSRHDSLRWYVSGGVGKLSIRDGFLQSNDDYVNPPEKEGAWTWFVLRDYGFCGNSWPIHPAVEMRDYNFLDKELYHRVR